MNGNRIDRADRMIATESERVFHAFVTASDLQAWLPPQGMAGEVHEFNPVEGGGYVMTLRHLSHQPAVEGKTTELEDKVCVVFDELRPYERIVQRVSFDTSNTAFAGEMRMTWTFAETSDGTQVRVACENVPAGIRPEVHQVGLNSSLENLARLLE